jgi:hypothetical protein
MADLVWEDHFNNDRECGGEDHTETSTEKAARLARVKAYNDSLIINVLEESEYSLEEPTETARPNHFVRGSL